MAEGGDYGRREALFAAERPVISEEEQRSAAREGRRKTRLRRWFSTLSTLMALVLFGGLVWYAYNWGTGEIEEGQLPIIRASTVPEKEAPEERGGLNVPYQDALVLNGSQGEQVERIVPPPEEPLLLEALPAPQEETSADQPKAVEEAPAEAGEDAIGQMIQMAELDNVSSDAPESAAPESSVVLPDIKPAAEATPEAAPDPAPEPTQTQTAQVGQVSGFKVQLASLQDPEGAQKEWKRLQGIHPELLGNLSMQTQKVEIEGRGTFYRIQAGPLPSRETADDLCALLKGRDQPCIVVAP
jgi:hypothetical protein